MNFINENGGLKMNPLERKKILKEQFKKRKKEQKAILSFHEFNIKVNTDLLRKYRKERGGVNY
ncbi:hypothetical protein [Caldibacillus debilis]|nr:hypothetical protein [Caldibacillus debilis]